MIKRSKAFCSPGLQGPSLLPWMLLAILLGILTIGSGIGLLGLSAYLLSEAALHPPLATLAVAILGVRIFGLVRGIWRYLERLVSHDVTFRVLARLRIWFYGALEPLAPARLFASREAGHTTGDLLSRFVGDIETLQELYARALAPPVVALLIGILVWLFLGAYNAVFALTFLCFFLLAGIGVPVCAHLLSRKLEIQIVAARSVLTTALVESFQGMADILAFDQAEAQSERVQAYNRQLIALQTGRAAIEGIRSMLDTLLPDGCIWVMVLTAIPLVSTAQLPGVYLAGIVLAAFGSFEALQPLSGTAQLLSGCKEAASRLVAITDAQPLTRDPLEAVPRPSHVDLEIRHLSFRYTPDSPLVLDDLSFTLREGHCLVIVGASGAGKSTLINLLARFWEYEQGTILLGGRELRTVQQQDLRQLLGVVEQRTHLFNLTIRENLLLACPHAGQEAVEQAARQAGMHTCIEALPQRYETLVGEQGFKLSGGERQRMALARAFLKDAPLLILDEPTAHQDLLTEQHILQALRASLPGRTLLLITHRLVGLDMADEILYLEQGKVKERGTHQKLLQMQGLYWKDWFLQHHR